MSRTLAAVLCTLLAVVCLAAGAAEPFDSDYEFGDDSKHAAYVKVVIVSKQDDAGKWVNEVKLQHGTEQAPWRVVVEQKMVDQGGRQSVELTAILTGPSTTVPHHAAELDGRNAADLEDFGKHSHYPDIYKPETGFGDDIHFWKHGSHYKLHTKLVDWKTANKTCAEEEAHLAVINSEEEAQFLAVLINRYSDPFKGAFVGITDEAEEGKWLTVLGESTLEAGFARWFRDDQPDNANGNENCGALFPSTNAGFNDVPCTGYPLHFICEKDQTTQSPNIEPERESYSLVPGLSSSYKVHTTQLDWETANKTCVEEGAHLAVINSQKEAMALVQMVDRYGTDDGAFVGITDKDEEGTWITVFGETLAEAGFARWVSFEGSDNPDSIENCGAIFHGTGLYHDVPCTGYQLPFICEKEEKDKKDEDGAELKNEEFTLDNSKYIFHASSDKTWHEALLECQQSSGYLAIINSESEANVLLEVLNKHLKGTTTNSAFVGMNDRESEEFKTIFGNSLEESGFTRWYKDDQPTYDYEADNCGGIHSSNGRLNAVPCNVMLPFFCEIDVESPDHHTLEEVPDEEPFTGTEMSKSDPIALGYEQHPVLNYYKLHASADKDWEEARLTCEAEGGFLATIESIEEFEFLKRMLVRPPLYGKCKAFIGIANLVDGLSGQNDDYDYSYSENVNHGKCGSIQFSQEKVGFVACEDHNPFICEINQNRGEVEVATVEQREEFDNSVYPLVYSTSPSEQESVDIMTIVRYLQLNRGAGDSTEQPLQNELFDDEMPSNEFISREFDYEAMENAAITIR